MVDKPHFPKHPPDSTHQPQGPHGKKGSGFSYEKGEWHAKPMTFLGMYFDADQAKKLWNVIIQTIGQAIAHDKEKALKALKKLKGDHPDDS